ncbi:hypothetical protein EII22_09015 [Coriobacteriales bacterium OH1046]|nr:hypothetical protein EII22_09015 [Coriobacteriales bacterium OH1046]
MSAEDSLRLLTDYEYFEMEPGPDLDDEAVRLWRNQIDYAYFAANLGWDYGQYGSCTPVQLLFIRKEIENRTVRESNLLKDAVQVAVANCLGKRKSSLWKRRSRVRVDPAMPIAEIEAIQEQLARAAPWTPWQGGGAEVG